MSVDIEAFCRWVRAQGATEQTLPAFRIGGTRLLGRAKGGPIAQSHIDEAVAAQAAAGAPPADVRDLQRIGAALLRFQQEAPPAPVPAPDRPAFKVVDARLAEGANRFDARNPILQPRNMALVALGVVLVLWAGWWMFRRAVIGRRDAVIETMSAYHRASRRGKFLVTTTLSPVVDVTLVFRSPPRNDRRNVRLRFSSVALESEKVVDWAFIAGHATKPQDPEAGPPLGVPLEVTVPLEMKKDFQAQRTDLVLTGTLEWGSLRQDTHKVSLGPFFERKR